ncbi:MAG: dihydroorotase [Candidatus Kuenenia sp.]|nr:dihydroorotase [Candidatus Kuenenia hertensis]
MNELLIKGGYVVDPASGFEGYADILVKDGKIEAVSTNITANHSVRIIDATNKHIIPGLIDCHVHFREPGLEYKEDISTGSRAAAKGGYTTVICEPNTNPTIDSPAMVDLLSERISKKSVINVFTKACITKGSLSEELTDIAALTKHKRVKALSDDGNPVFNDALMEKACKLSAQHSIIISPHCEDSPVYLNKIKENPNATRFPGEPYSHETDFAKRDIRYTEQARGRLHISHISLKNTLAAIQQAKERDIGKITCEVTPHHLLLDNSFRDKDGNTPKTNPPLRSREDRDALQRGLVNGILDVIATDHAPHTDDDLKKGATGFVGLETALGVLLAKLVHPGFITFKELIAKMSTNPARIFQINGGSLAEGMPADIAIVDINKEWTVDVNAFESKGRNCPFHGWRLKGKVSTTIIDGKVIVDNYRIQC